MKAPCSHFGKCSGCTLQQFPYVKQLADKTKLIQREFAELVAKLPEGNARIHATVPSPEPFAYRISSKLCLHEDDQGKRSIGLYRQKSKQVLDIANCPVHHPGINKLIDRLFRRKIPAPAPFYNHSKKGFQAGKLKFITIRYNPTAEMFGVVISHTGVPHEVLQMWCKTVVNNNSISFYESQLEKNDADLVLSRHVEHLAGPEFFRFDLDERTYHLDPLSFFQANGALLPQFVLHIIDGLKGDTLVDLYGGFGAYAFAASKNFRSVELVEANERAILTAEKTVQSQGLQHFKSFATSVEDYLKMRLKNSDLSKIEAMIVNPPRSGLSPVVRELLGHSKWRNLRDLHYVSCDWKTLKRDLKALEKCGFELKSLTPFDMFPQTDHIELVAKLVRRSRSLTSL